MTKNEDLSAKLRDFKCLGRETDSLDFGSKDIYELNDCRRDIDPLALKAKGEDWKPKVMDEFSINRENGSIDSSRKEGQNGLPHHRSGWEKNADSLSPDKSHKEVEQRSPMHERLMTVQGSTGNGNESRNSNSPCNGSSHLFHMEKNLFADENVLDCELPELEVRYKEMNHHMVKDICVDEGRTAKDKILIENIKGDKSGHFIRQPPNEHIHCIARGDTEFFLSEAMDDALLENTNGLSANQCDSKEKKYSRLVAQEKLKSHSDCTSVEDTAKCCHLEDSTEMGKENCGTTDKAAADSLEEDFLVDRKLSIQETGKQSSLRSFPNSSDGKVNRVAQLLHQIPEGKAASEGPAVASVDSGVLQEDVQGGSLLDDGKTGNGSITSNLNSPKQVVADIKNGTSEDVKVQSTDLCDMHNHKDDNAGYISDAGLVRHTSSSTGNVHRKSLIMMDGNYEGSSCTSHVPCDRGKDRNLENVHVQKDGKSDDLSADGQVQFPGNKSQSSTNDAVRFEPNAPTNQCKNPDNASAVGQLQNDKGETSFSAASLISFSGPMVVSGSMSHRSDSSTTSARSFAFPVLQSEWNGSPVKMREAEREQLRKQRFWKSGFLCCRF